MIKQIKNQDTIKLINDGYNIHKSGCVENFKAIRETRQKKVQWYMIKKYHTVLK